MKVGILPHLVHPFTDKKSGAKLSKIEKTVACLSIFVMPPFVPNPLNFYTFTYIALEYESRLVEISETESASSDEESKESEKKSRRSSLSLERIRNKVRKKVPSMIDEADVYSEGIRSQEVSSTESSE